MRFIFRTNYDQDIDLARDRVDRFWYGLLLAALLVAPLTLEAFWIGELSYVFIMGVVSVGLMLLIGFTGQASIGHGAFLGIGAYIHAILLARGYDFFTSALCATLGTSLIGMALGFPTLRLIGIYLAMATLAFAVIVEFVLVHWESVTNGFSGFRVSDPTVFGHAVSEPATLYYLSLAAVVGTTLVALNLLRSPSGRAFVAIRDSEIAAQSMGVHLARYKTTAFAISAGMTGLGGALFAHKIGFLAPDAFGIMLSIQLLLMVVVGGMGSIRGALFGALFVGALPQLIALSRDSLPARIAEQPGLEPGVFGLILVAAIIFEPAGIDGRWVKIKLFFSRFPLYRKATFVRQKMYMKTERLK